MEYGLKDNVLNKVIDVFKNHKEIEKVIIYGSRAKGNFNNGSDIDLTFLGKDVTLKVLNKTSLELDDLLLPYIFDLSIFNHIKNPDLIDHINRIGKTIYKKIN